MTKTIHTTNRSQAGFTLVELAVVMIIIGLLIGGVLKGQELISNAQITSTISQVKGVEGATSTFRDMYNALPGDMTNPGTRLSGCTVAPCSRAGDGNGRLDSVPGAAAVAASEAVAFWAQLNAADLFSGVDGSATVAWGQALPEASIGGGFTAGFTQTGALTAATGGNGRGGHYLSLQGAPDTAVAAGNGAISASQAARIDRKMDDGNPNGGSVRAAGGATCADNAAQGVYEEADDNVSCSVYIRIQG